MVRKWCLVFATLLVAGFAAGEEANLAVQDNEDVAYCFRLTWVGPGYDNTTGNSINGSCSDEDMKKLYPICKDPMVITDNGAYPNFTYLWKSYQHNKLRIACPLSGGFVCAKWTSYYEDQVEFTMHLCSKITVEKEGALKSGCLRSRANNSRITEVCACSSYPGSMPCNTAVSNSFSLLLFTSLLVVAFTSLLNSLKLL